MQIVDIIEGTGSNYILLCKSKGEYKLMSETDTMIGMIRELVESFKKIGMTDEEIVAKILNKKSE